MNVGLRLCFLGLALGLTALGAGCGDNSASSAAAGGGGSGGAGASGGQGGLAAGGGGASGGGPTGGSGGVDLPQGTLCIPDDDDAPALFVGSEGDDGNPGTYDQPLATFEQALALVAPGQDIRVLAGTYTEKLQIEKSGTADQPLRILPAKGEKVLLDATGSPAGKPIDVLGSFVIVQGFEVTGSGNQCVDAPGTDIVLCRLDVHDCQSHGIQIGGQRVRAEGNVIRGASLENENGGLGQSGWGSALKVKVGGEDITLLRNRIFHNWGEGVAVTRGKSVTVRENWVYDNFAVNYYVDNSIDVVVERNLATCTPDSGFEREGKRANAYQIGEEYYDGWGAQLSGITIRNNIALFCNRGFLFPGSDVGGGLVNVAVVHNTFWGSVDTGLSITHEPVTAGTIVHDNLVQQPDGKDVWIEDLAGLTVSHNLWVSGVPDDYTNGSGPGDVLGDPGLYTTPDYKAASFRLSEASPARNAALTLPGLDEDFEGRPRHAPGSDDADIGAMEYGDPAAPCAFDALFGL
jgi:hypothetical protein